MHEMRLTSYQILYQSCFNPLFIQTDSRDQHSDVLLCQDNQHGGLLRQLPGRADSSQLDSRVFLWNVTQNELHHYRNSKTTDFRVSKCKSLINFTHPYSQAIWISAGVASINFLCTFIGLFLVERIGRRKLLLWSLLGVVVALGFLGGGFLWSDSRDWEIQ